MGFLDDIGSWVGDLFGDGSTDSSSVDAVNGSDLMSNVGETQASDASVLGGSSGLAGDATLSMAPDSGYMGTGSAGAGAAGENATTPEGNAVNNGSFTTGNEPTSQQSSPVSARGAVTAARRAASSNSGTSWLQRLMAGGGAENRQAQMALTGLGLLNAIMSRQSAPNAAALRASLQGPYNSFTPAGQTAFNNYMNMPVHTYTPPTGGYIGHKRGGRVGGGGALRYCSGGMVPGYAMGGGVYPPVGPGSLGPGTGAAHSIMGNDQNVAMSPFQMGGNPGVSTIGGPTTFTPPGGLGIRPQGGGSFGPQMAGRFGLGPSVGGNGFGGGTMMQPGGMVQPFSPLSILRNKMQNDSFDPSNFADSHPNFAANHPWLFNNKTPNAGPPMPSTQGPQNYADGGFVPGADPGQADTVPIRVSPGEYVFDADTVASLGDGNNAAGAKVLDRMRQHIRNVKRQGPANDIPPALHGGGALRFLR